MAGKILIVDELATNRIVLKVKLSTTPYDVLQASTAQEALGLVARERPDLVLANSRIAGTDLPEFITALRRVTGIAGTPILLMQAQYCPEERHAALRAGADDILTKPVAEACLLARLRNLLRQHHADHELAEQAGGAATGPGFADVQTAFAAPGRIALIGASRAEAVALRGLLAANSPHACTALSMDSLGAQRAVDLYVIRIGLAQAEDGLRLLADLKAAQATRGCPVIALLEADAGSLGVTLLDIGADDVLTGPPDPVELCLRIDLQMRRKRRNEGLRAHLRSGLQAAIIDPLTGAYNRRHALPFLDRQLALAASGDRPVAVMLADLDFFKQVNDRHGHAAGDAVLCALTRTLRAHLREPDMLARIGGEEFLIVLPGTSQQRARRIAERLCHRVGATAVPVSGIEQPISVTISIGVTMASCRPGLPVPTVDGLLKEADRALYLAKAQGRNQASFCTRSAA